MSESITTELSADEASRVQSALRHRAAAVSPARAPVGEVHLLVARRRRHRAGGALAVAGVAVLGGLAFSNRSGVDEPPASGDRVPSATVVVPLDTTPPLDAIPMPTIGAYPSDPAHGPQLAKVTYAVKEGDTFESIAAELGVDPATVRTQTGGKIVAGEVISLLVGPSPAVGAVAVTSTIG